MIFIENCSKDRETNIADDSLMVLRKFELIKGNQITNACHLLFSKNDVFSAAIELGRFSTPTSIKYGLTIRTDLFSEVDEILNFIKKHINKEYIITGDPRREVRWQYPLLAIREIAINMVVHRDYINSGYSSIKIYDDRIEFFNPGRLPEGLTIKELLSGDYASDARNRKTAFAFKEAQFIEKYGSGIKRIQEGFVNYGLKAPLFENKQHGFRITVYSEVDKISEKVAAKVAVKIIEVINENPRITISELARLLNVPMRTIERNIHSLQKENKLERISPANGGYWQVLQ